ncbi:MAG: tRNA pseudouridine(55) synthase TruB [Hyphomicrobiales bacterium]|jgi:tRNA pseudouridine55 synthase|nr:tRNA pseudouridine(55) synthase TruB [Hyphomicrobiales bacterium]
MSDADLPQREPRPKKRDVNGWIILDKPVQETSTHAVAVVKRALQAKKAGHAGTLDPLASGLLPIAMGEATKTVPFVMDGRKAYRFTVTWGAETATDDAEGEVIRTSAVRPARDAIEAILPRFTGTVLQVPPKFSAIKIAGERAYDLARDGEDVVLEARPVEIDSLHLVAHDDKTATFEAECGKGTYVRALARDFGRLLGCFGHVTALRRTRVGPFTEAHATPLSAFQAGGLAGDALAALLAPVDRALSAIPALSISRNDAGRLQRGQSCLLRGADAPIELEAVAVFCQGQLVAIGEVLHGELHPRRVFHLGR